jgi:nitrite reductase/ring-hydroxylating ferredoxin subunit
VRRKSSPTVAKKLLIVCREIQPPRLPESIIKNRGVKGEDWREDFVKKVLFVFLFIGLAVGAMAAAQQAADQTQVIDLGPSEAWRPGVVKALPQFKIIVFSDSEGVWALATECPHRKCVVNFKEKENIFVCPCHEARFARDGALQRGPATRDLPWFEVTSGPDGRLVVDKTKIVPRGTKWRART